MLKLRKIAITGGVASGKSTVCEFFRELGAYTVSADAIVHELLKNENRSELAKRVFQNPEELKKLEALLHPAVLQRIEELYVAACEAEKYTSFVAEIPLLFEVGWQDKFDIVITVLRDEHEAKKSFAHTDYDLRMQRQMKPQEKALKSTYTINNTGSLIDLHQAVVRINKGVSTQ